MNKRFALHFGLCNALLAAYCFTLITLTHSFVDAPATTAAVVFKDRVKETTTTTGTGTLTLGGAITGYQSFAAVGNGNECYAAIYAVNASGVPTGSWEVFRGVYTASGTTLTRAEVKSSSNSNNAVNFSAGTKHVILGNPAAATVSAELTNPVVWDNLIGAGNWPPESGRELRLSLSAQYANGLAIRNTDTRGYSSFTSRTHDNYEKMAIGWGNPDSDAFFRNTVYWEGWSGVTSVAPPPEILIAQDYNDGVDGFKSYRRFRIKTNGDVAIPKREANATDPADALLVDVNANVVVGSAALATDATNGFLYIPTCAGTPSGTPTAKTGRVPMVLDSSTGKLMIYSGGTWNAYSKD